MNNKYAYIHIEKCAGTSLHKILEYNDSRYWVLNPKVFHTNGIDYPLSITDTNRILKSFFVKGIGGHSIRPYRLDESILERSFTFFRNPDKRYVSHYLHQKHKMGIDRSFEEFLEDDYYGNFITKSLSLEGNITEAKELISKIGYVGLMEDFESSLRELNLIIFNNELQMYRNHEMQNHSNSEAEDLFMKYRMEIKNSNENDWILYNIVTSKSFRKKYALGNKLGDFKKVNMIIEVKRKSLRLIKNNTWCYL